MGTLRAAGFVRVVRELDGGGALRGGSGVVPGRSAAALLLRGPGERRQAAVPAELVEEGFVRHVLGGHVLFLFRPVSQGRSV